MEFSHNELKDAHWLFDTPGIMKEHDVRPLPFLATHALPVLYTVQYSPPKVVLFTT